MSVSGLDHIGLVVRDLDRCAAFFGALGFSMTPRTDLMRPGPNGPEPSGAANRCIMFDSGYIELQGIDDPSRGHMLVPYLDKREGLHVIVFAADDADRARAEAEARGVGGTRVQRWERDVTTGAGTRRAAFRFFGYPTDMTPEGYCGVVQHLTPDAVRPPGVTMHTNGATALIDVVLSATDPAATHARFARLTGRADGTGLTIVDATLAAAIAPNLPSAPSIAAATIRVPDAPAMADRITRAGATPIPVPHGVVVGPDDGFGAAWRFMEA